MTALPAAYVGSATQHGTPLTGAGTRNITINGRPAWVADIPHSCSVHGPETVGVGSETVLFNSKRAARANDGARNAGDYLQGVGPPDQIMQGSPNVFIGTPALGVATAANEALFCQQYCKLTHDWATLTPEQRQQRYEELLATMFAAFGAPPPGTNQGLGPGADASWDRTLWRVNVAANAWGDPKGPPAGRVTLHEIRHAEQTFNAMRYACGMGPSDARPDVLAAAAGKPPLNLPPIDPDSPEGRFGLLHAANEISEAGINNRNAIIIELGAAATADPTLTSKRYIDAVEAYYNQPGGADARTVEQAGQCYGCP